MNTWADLNHLQTGRYGEYFAKMALVRAGFDVFSPEVDDKGIDFVLRIDGDLPRYYDVQVKTVRSKSTYVFMRKDKFRLIPNLLLALVILDAGREPEMYLIPASAWRDAKPPFTDRDYGGLKSSPEYGLTLSPPAMAPLEPYALPEQYRRSPRPISSSGIATPHRPIASQGWSFRAVAKRRLARDKACLVPACQHNRAI